MLGDCYNVIGLKSENDHLIRKSRMRQPKKLGKYILKMSDFLIQEPSTIQKPFKTHRYKPGLQHRHIVNFHCKTTS